MVQVPETRSLWLIAAVNLPMERQETIVITAEKLELATNVAALGRYSDFWAISSNIWAVCCGTRDTSD